MIGDFHRFGDIYTSIAGLQALALFSSLGVQAIGFGLKCSAPVEVGQPSVLIATGSIPRHLRRKFMAGVC